MNKNTKAKIKLIKIFKTYDYDWLGCKITKENPLTYHHIFKNVYGSWEEFDKNYKINNGSLLTETTHVLMHKLERLDPLGYKHLNEVLKSLNDTKKAPNREHYDKCRVLLKKYNQKEQK